MDNLLIPFREPYLICRNGHEDQAAIFPAGETRTTAGHVRLIYRCAICGAEYVIEYYAPAVA